MPGAVDNSIDNPLSTPADSAGMERDVHFHDLRNLKYKGDGVVVFAKFLGGIFLLTVSSFIIAVPDGCSSTPAEGEWPTEQALFYISIFPSVVVMCESPTLNIAEATMSVI